MSDSATLATLPERLSASSAVYRDPLAQVDWETLDADAAWMPDELVSLYGLPEWEAMTEEQRRRLSRCEFVAFLELGLWLESLFMQRIAVQACQGPAAGLEDYTYLLHEMREEAGHSLMFAEVMRRGGIPPMASRDVRPRLANAFGRLAPFGSAGFWATILIGEAVPDQVNRLMHRDERLPTAVRQVVAVHMREEARHIAYARERVAAKLAARGTIAKRSLALLLRQVLKQFINQCFYPPAQVYAQAGLERPQALVRRARHNPARAAVVERCTGPTVDFLADNGLPLRGRAGGGRAAEELD